MQAKPKLWAKEERIQWGCVLMQMLGESSLEHLHLVFCGLYSIEDSRQVAPFKKAVHTARSILSDLVTKNAVQSAVYEFQSEAKHRSFMIDSKTLHFTAIYPDGLDPYIVKAQDILNSGLEQHSYDLEIASSEADLLAEIDHKTRVPIRMHGLQFPKPKQHGLTHRPRSPIVIRWCELVELAAQLDQEDIDAKRPPLNWSMRIEPIQLQATTGMGLRDSTILDLSGLKHLIGLPGAGKTTLITLLCVLLKRRGQRAAVFFTSIEVAREYLETLRRYDVKVAILMGRSGQTHRRHANRMAELIASQGEGGFGRTREGVELFATSCPLPAFADAWPQPWRLGVAPCESLIEVGSDKRKLCPAWERCGRVKNQRELVHADIWLGHVRSADTRVPAHTSIKQLRYFELIAHTFDLIIFDECDETQKVLDEYGALTLQFTGNDDSLHIAIQRVTEQLAANRRHVSDDMLRYMMHANEFERHMLRFLNEIRHLFADKRTQRLANEYADKLLSANFLIREALVAAGTSSEFNMEALSAVSDFWERAMYRAFFFRGREKAWPKAEKYASALYLDVPDADRVAEANKRWLRVNDALKRYLTLDHAAEAEEIVDEIANELAPLFRAPSIDSIRSQVRLLIVVGFTVASYQRLAKTGRPLAQRGEMPEDLTFAKASPEMREVVPRSILGTFSAVRYRRSPDKDGFEIDYLVMDATPRLLMHRLHEVGRANVLLTSATSWLKPSTEYHVAKKPDYVLSPNFDEVGSVRLYALPKRHPATKKPLRFSGAGADREDNLRHMVTALAQSDAGGLSELERAVRSVTTELDRPRKAALIVNSYEQVRLVVEQINDVNALLGDRTRGVLNELPKDRSRTRYVLKGQVEELGRTQDVNVVVFPIAALGRGVNIVIRSDDDDNGKAAVGSVYFLTRPHPAAGDLSLMTSMLAQATQVLDGKDFSQLSLVEVKRAYDTDRYQAYRRVANLLARPMSASNLDRETLRHFAANLLVPILQTIGRGMRKRMPVDVYFVDAAWAPQSAEEKPERDRSSILVIMRQVLEECFADPDPDQRQVYEALYGVFREAFRNIIGLIPPQKSQTIPADLFDPSPVTSEADFDGYDPDAFVEEQGQDEDVFSPFEYEDDEDNIVDEVFEDEEYV